MKKRKQSIVSIIHIFFSFFFEQHQIVCLGSGYFGRIRVLANGRVQDLILQPSNVQIYTTQNPGYGSEYHIILQYPFPGEYLLCRYKVGAQSSISPIFPHIPHSFPILLSIFWRIFTGLLLGGGSTQDFSSLFPYLPIFSRLFPFSFHFLENIYLAVTRRGPNSVFPLSFPIFSHYSLHFLENIHKAVTRQRLNPVFPPFHIFPLFLSIF